jgi:hypothetical protein
VACITAEANSAAVVRATRLLAGDRQTVLRTTRLNEVSAPSKGEDAGVAPEKVAQAVQQLD